MTKEEFTNLKVGDLVYTKIFGTNGYDWHLCFVDQKNDNDVHVVSSPLVTVSDGYYVSRYSDTKGYDELMAPDYFIKNHLIKDMNGAILTMGNSSLSVSDPKFEVGEIVTYQGDAYTIIDHKFDCMHLYKLTSIDFWIAEELIKKNYGKFRKNDIVRVKDKDSVYFGEIFRIFGRSDQYTYRLSNGLLFKEDELELFNFKPFDKVIVRNKDTRWYPRFFSNMNAADGWHFETTDNEVWEACLPYEGNENLIGTAENNNYKI